MTEEEKKKFGEWLNSPDAKSVLAHEMISMGGGGLHFETPESNGFPANRFVGRLKGYMYELVHDRVKPEERCCIGIDTIYPYATKEEIGALNLLQQKIEEQTEKEVPPFDDGYVGLLEGMAIYIYKKDIAMLYAEVDIDLNKNSNDGIPSYAYQRLHLKAGLQLAKCDKSRDEVIQVLMNDGIAEKGATMIVDRMVAVVKQQRKKNGLKQFIIGAVILAIGMLITGISYSSASESNGGRFILAWGALGGGGYYTVAGIINYIKAIRYKG